MHWLNHTPHIDKKICWTYNHIEFATNIMFESRCKFVKPKMAQLVMGMSYKAFTFFWVNHYSHMFIYPHSLERITFLFESIDLMHDLMMSLGCQTNWDFTCLQICNNRFIIIYVLGNCYWCKQSFPLWSIPQNVILTLSPSFNAI
jgi:hypothetical protein